MAEQVPLWHDCFEDALGAAVQALGGAKKVSALLWPVQAQQKPETAYTRVRACLNPDKAEKFSPDELLVLIRQAAEVGDHSIMRYIGREGRYEVTPLSPEDAEKRAKSARRRALLAELASLEDEP